METMTRNEALHRAVCALASQDIDMATERNGVGFNGHDTKFGHRMASIPPADWSDDMAVEVAYMLKTYRTQLLTYGIDIDDLPKVEGKRNVEARQDARRKIQNTPYAIVQAGEIRVYNSFSIKDELKSAGYRFAGFDKSWTAPVSKRSAAKVVELHVELRDGAADIMAAANEPDVVEATPKGKVMYDAQNDLIHITSEYDPELVQAIKKLPGRKWDPVNKINTCFPEPVVLELADKYGLEVSPLAHNAITSAVARLAASSATEVANYSGALKGTLRAYQEAGAQYAIDNPHSINADDMGLGKTLQTIAAAETKGAFPVLVTCPASLRGNWIREIQRWSPHRSAAIWDGKGDAPDTDYVVVSYEAMTKAAQNA